MRKLDPQSLGEHLDRLYRAAWALCGSREDAEDLVQDTFARVLARPRHIRGESDLAYLMQVLRNTFLTSRRTAGRRPRIAATLEDFEFADPRRGSRPEDAVATSAVFEAIAELPEPFRLALIAVDIVGLSYREAGRALDTPEATVTTRLYRARQQVMRALAPGDEPEGARAQIDPAPAGDPAPAADHRDPARPPPPDTPALTGGQRGAGEEPGRNRPSRTS